MRAQYARARDQQIEKAPVSAPSPRVQMQSAGPLNPTVVNIGAGLAVLLGIVTQIAVIAAARRGDFDLPTACVTFAVGVGLTVAGLWHYYSVFVIERGRRASAAKIARQHPNAPWLLNDAWAQRKVVDRSGLHTTIFLWIWAIGWWVFCAFLWDFSASGMLAAAQSSWLQAGLLLVLAATGLLGIAAAIAATFRWLCYGVSTLHIDTLPGYLGNRFRGTVSAHVPADLPLEAEVTCENVTVIWTRTPKGGRKKEFIYKPLWTQRWPLERDRMTRTKDGGVVIPIDVALPDDKPEFALDEEGGGIRWVLRVGSHFMAENAGVQQLHLWGPQPFAAEYLIPVYARP